MTRCEYYIKRDGNLNKALEDYKNYIKTINGQYSNSTRLYSNWLTKEYVEKPNPILDKVEHKYLESFLKPFRNKVTGINILKTILLASSKKEDLRKFIFFKVNIGHF